MRKIKLLLAATAAMVGMTAQAITFDTDLTGRFSSLTNVGSWTGASGYTGTDFCPMVEVGGGIGMKQVCERYVSTCNETGDIFYATVTGLSAGTYRIELYGGAAYTFGRGFTSTAFSEGTWNAGDKIEPTDEVSTGVTLYAESEGATYGGEIPIYYATNFPDGAATVTIDGIVVGSSGSIKIGMSKTSTSTNWHVIQLKSVTATVDADELLANAVARAKEIDQSLLSSTVAANLQNVIDTYDGATFATADEYRKAIDTIDAAVDAANVYIEATPVLSAMKEVVDATNFYTTEAYEEYYGQWATKYENGTLTAAEASALQNPTTTTGWHASITVDNFLLSVWDVEPDFAGAYYINTWSVEGNNDGTEFRTPFFEYWTGDGNSLAARTMTATIADLNPEDLYMVEIWARVRQRNDGTKVPGSITMQVGEGMSVDLTSGEQVGSSQFYLDHFTAVGSVDADGNLVVKINVAANSSISWLSFKNVKYSTVDDVRIPLALELQRLVNTATNLMETAPTSGAYYELDRVVAEYEGLEYTAKDQAGFEKAIADAQAVIEGVGTIAGPKAQNAVILEKANKAFELGTSDKEEKLVSLIDANDYDVDDQATGAGIEAINQALLDAMCEHIGAIEIPEDGQLDLTFLLTNPDVTGLPTWRGAEGWYTEQTTGNSQVMTNDAATSEDGEKTAFYEFWTYTAQTNGKFALYQQVTLPEGTYSISCYAFAKEQDDPANTGDKRGVRFYANDTEGSAVYTSRLSEANIDFFNPETQEVKIGLKTVSPNSYNWMGIGYVQLFKVAPKPIVVDEAVAYTPASAAGNVTLKRTFSGEWESFVVPFQIKEDELKAAFGNSVAVAEFQEEVEMEDVEVEVLDEETGEYSYETRSEATGNSTISFKPMDAPAITPNKPVLIKVATDKKEFVFENRTIAAGQQAVTGVNFDFVGTYTPATTVAAGDYYVAGQADGVKILLADGTQKIGGTRAFIQSKGEGVILNDVATAIRQLNAPAAQNAAIFNLAGQQVSKAQKGIYIVGGKKVVVK